MINVKRLYQVVMLILSVILAYLLIKFAPLFLPLIKFIFTILAPFIIAAFISYLLYPIVEKLAKMKINKALAVTCIYLVFFSGIGLALYKGLPIFIGQLQEFGEQLPKIMTMYEDGIYALFENTSFLPEVFHDKMKLVIQSFEIKLEEKLEVIFTKVINIIDAILVIVIVPVLVFYMLIDYERVKRTVYQWLSSEHLKQTDTILQAIDKSLGNYLRGQITISALVTLITFLMYHTLQLKYALLLAIIMGIMNIIPYFGPIIGSIPAVFIAMTTSWRLAVVIIITNLIIQLIENSFFSPYIMGKSVHLHPIAIILILIVGAELAGVIGMIVAVPLTTMIKAIYEQIHPKNSNAIDI